MPPAALLVANVPHELPAGRDPSGTASDVFLTIFFVPAFPLGHGVAGQQALLMAARDVLAMGFPDRLNRISLGGSHKPNSFTFVNKVHPSARTDLLFLRSRGPPAPPLALGASSPDRPSFSGSEFRTL